MPRNGGRWNRQVLLSGRYSSKFSGKKDCVPHCASKVKAEILTVPQISYWHASSLSSEAFHPTHDFFHSPDNGPIYKTEAGKSSSR